MRLDDGQGGEYFMLFDDGGWLRTPRYLVRHVFPKLSPTAIKVYMYLFELTSAWSEAEGTFVPTPTKASVRMIARGNEMSPTTVQKVLGELQAWNLVAVVDPGDRNTPATYALKRNIRGHRLADGTVVFEEASHIPVRPPDSAPPAGSDGHPAALSRPSRAAGVPKNGHQPPGVPKSEHPAAGRVSANGRNGAAAYQKLARSKDRIDLGEGDFQETDLAETDRGAAAGPPAPADASPEAVGALWAETLSNLSMQMLVAPFRAWLAGTWVYAAGEDSLAIVVRNDFAREWLETRLAGLVGAEVSRVFGRPLALEYLTREELAIADANH